jgi:hypothetical protein
MTLDELIKRLERADPELSVRHGFAKPMSYRGYYEQLAFEPAENVTVGSMLEHARSALGKTFTGYKGGEYEMHEYTDVWLARYGCTGESIGPVLLAYMLGDLT